VVAAVVVVVLLQQLDSESDSAGTLECLSGWSIDEDDNDADSGGGSCSGGDDVPARGGGGGGSWWVVGRVTVDMLSASVVVELNIRTKRLAILYIYIYWCVITMCIMINIAVVG
jgi:hypothetical protein